jgi:4-hydroxy-tetrahydrodipicolinate synthase
MHKSLYPLFGIVTVLNTPFSAADEVDLLALHRHVDAAIAAGVAGFLVPAMAAEVYKLSERERRAMVETVVAACAGRVPVIGGAGSTDAAQRERIARDILAAGCANLLLQIPFTGAHEYRDAVLRVAELGPAMLMLQDWDFGGGGLPLELICQLFAEVDAFRCLKIETTPAGPKYTAVLDATDGRLHVSGGWAVSNMLEAFDRGVHAFMPTGLHELYTLIDALYRRGDVAGATWWFEKTLPILAFSNQHLDISIHFFKRLLYRQGIYPTPHVRQPILPFDAYHERRADMLIPYALDLMASAAAVRTGLT